MFNGTFFTYVFLNNHLYKFCLLSNLKNHFVYLLGIVRNLDEKIKVVVVFCFVLQIADTLNQK